MDTKHFLKNILSNNKNETVYKYGIDSEGLNLYLPKQLFKKAEKYDVNELLQQQHAFLKTLENDGIAEPLPNGFVVSSDDVLTFDENTIELLKLPPRWTGNIKLDIKGNAISGYTDCILTFILPDNEILNFYNIDGPFLKFSEQKQFLLTPYLFNALKHHKQFKKQKNNGVHYTESKFYHLFSSFEIAKLHGESISLGHLDNGFSIIPASEEDLDVSISLTLNEDGSGELIPIFNNCSAKAEDIKTRLNQLDFNKINDEQILRVDKQIILINKKRLEAINEIITTKKISKTDIKEFQKNPTAFIDGSKVNLENGYGLRVKGVTAYKQAYFGETDESGIDWFGKALEKTSILSVIDNFKNSPEILIEIETLINDAEKNNANFIEFENKTYSLGSDEDKQDAKNKIKENITNVSIEKEIPEEITNVKNENDEPNEELILDATSNDEELDYTKEIDVFINNIMYDKKLNFENYKRTPYSHQDYGIRWMLGLIQKGVPGALLADDMGLGKTFIALSAIEQSKLLNFSKDSNKPTIIIAPLSLLDNWKEEIFKSFKNSPFKDIIILNGTELTKFKISKNSGSELKNQALDALDDMDKIRYALKIGNNFSDNERLDIPNRLIITTYQTLRDYQFSLCKIQWKFAIFDEAQNIKNPNALQTRAAKALNADFTLMVTGTPVENKLTDFWCIMDTAVPNEQLLGTYQDFRKKYMTPIVRAKENKFEVQLKVGQELRKVVKYFMLRRNKEDKLKDLPKKRLFCGIDDQYTEYLPILSKTMSGIQLKNYEAVLQTVALSDKKNGIALKALHNLRNISLHPSLHSSTNMPVGNSIKSLKEIMFLSGKFKSLIECLNDIKKRDEKVIIFAINKQLQAFLKGTLSKLYNIHDVMVINGDTKAIAKKNSKLKSRIELIKEFESTIGFNIIIMSPVAAGVGLTIVEANNVIHFERHWNPAKESQATDRVYRIGQKKDVNVYYPILKHPKIESFDVSLHRLLANKIILKDAIVTPEEVVPEDCIPNTDAGLNNNIILPDELSQLDWKQFEAFCAIWARKIFNTSDAFLTELSNDHGADVVVLDNDGVLIQCKQTLNNKYSKNDGIRELNSAPAYYEQKYNRKFKKKLFMTNAHIVSTRVKKEAKLYNVDIITEKELKKMLKTEKITYRELEELLNKQSE